MRDYYRFEDTRFYGNTNWAGEYRREDLYPSTDRHGCIIIPDKDLAMEMKADGFKVHATKPYGDDDPDQFEPEYFVDCYIKFIVDGAKSDPRVFIIDEDNYEIPVGAETMKMFDYDDDRGGRSRRRRMLIKPNGVTVLCRSWRYTPDSSPKLFVNVMRVKQDTELDPWAGMYKRRPQE